MVTGMPEIRIKRTSFYNYDLLLCIPGIFMRSASGHVIFATPAFSSECGVQ
jgi:hypothetical protein